MTITLVFSSFEHKECVWCVVWRLDGAVLASCSGDKTVRIWSSDGGTWCCKSTLMDGHSKTVRAATFSPCFRYLASVAFDATTVIWHKGSEGEFDVMTTLEGHENEVKAVAWSRSGQYLATCGRDKTVWIWEVDEDEEFECSSVLNAHTQDVKSVCWHPHKDVLASCSYDNTIKFHRFDGDDWTTTCTLSQHESTVWDIAFNASGTHLVSCSADCTVRIWKEYEPNNRFGISAIFGKGTPQNSTWKCVCTLSGYHNQPIYSVDWCPLTGLIATGCGDNAIRIFREEDSARGSDDAPIFALIDTVVNAHSEDVNCVRWNPAQAGLLASCGDDCEVKLWQVEHGM